MTAVVVIVVAALVAAAIVYWGTARLRALLARAGVGPRRGEDWEHWARAAPTDELRRSARIMERAQTQRVRDGLTRDSAREEHLRLVRAELSRRG